MKKKSRNQSITPKRPVHYFTKEYLDSVKDATPTQIVRYLEESKRIYFAGLKDNVENQEASTLISIRIPTDLLQAFKATAEVHNTKYQTLIKKLMRDYIGGK